MSFTLVFRRYAPFATFGLGFEGDHRSGPSLSLLASARTTGCVQFERGSVGSLVASSSGTRYSGGGEAVRRFLGRHVSGVAGSITNLRATATRVSFSAQTAGANPMVPKAPDIDTFVDVVVEWIADNLRIRGSVRGDDFPNAEVFVLDSTGSACLLFDGRTTGGRDTGPMTRLAGAHAAQNLGSFYCVMGLAPGGTFSSSKLSCGTTVMAGKPGAPAATWAGAGGGFSGGGATGRW